MSSANPNRCPTIAREWSSKKANRYVLRPAMVGAVQSVTGPHSFGRSASNRPNTASLPGPPAPSAPSTAAISGSVAKWRCRVRSPGDPI